MINKVIFFKNVKYMMFFANAALLAILVTIQKDSYLTSQSVRQFFFQQFFIVWLEPKKHNSFSAGLEQGI